MIKPCETNNARDMSSKKTAEVFVVTEDYVKLATPRNTIVLGSRGSGKTQLLRMLSYDLMCQLDRTKFTNLPDKNSLIGIYVAFSSFWAKDMKDKSWEKEQDYLYSFQWRVNLATCSAFIQCVNGILKEVVEDKFDRIIKASCIAEKLHEAWFFNRDSHIDSLEKLDNRISQYDNDRQSREHTLLAQGASSANHQMDSAIFDAALFSPIKTARDIVEQELAELNQPNWLICLDEADFLDAPYLRVINTCMRSRSERLFIKMSTMPFGHHVQETETPVSVDSGHDFEYLYIDHETTKPDSSLERQKFAFDLIKKHFGDKSKLLSRHDNLRSLLGESVILNPKKAPLDDTEFENALDKYANDRTKKRASKLKESGEIQKYKDSIVRKMNGALWLKSERASKKGHRKLETYSGTEVFLRCTDGNPRRILELSGLLLERGKDDGLPISPKVQNEVLVAYSKTVLERCRTEEGEGYFLHEFLKELLESLDRRFDNKISTDTVYSFKVKESCNCDIKQLIKRAVDLGLVYPNQRQAIIENFICEGVFHPAYILAPGYYLLPRQGTPVNLFSLICDKNNNMTPAEKEKVNQTMLFEV